MPTCPQFYKMGILANGRAGCVPAWDEGLGTAGIIQDGPAAQEPTQRQLEEQAERARLAMERAGSAVKKQQSIVDDLRAQVRGTIAGASAPAVNVNVQRFLILGTGALLLVVALASWGNQ